ncbi:D-alanyl-D-alanine carboxypeptidase family protein [Alkalihalobacillus sp. 1P02AB]|uniref:D-alanyl-D-alanine carboxypeptidase family protein n=1 Tax=Alkalihalobacillus sp. 1P02AB TaxID=3132260 RepID=UPI0039A49650
MNKVIVLSGTGLVALFLLMNSEHSLPFWPDKQINYLFESSKELEDNLYSEQFYLLRLDDEKVIYQKRHQQEISVASLTKMMTTLVAIEQLEQKEESVKIDADIFPILNEKNLVLAGFLPNEEVKAIDLLYGTLLPSGAEASVALANHIAGSEMNFVELMNQKANELHMNDTTFANVTGLDQENHYSTVYDMALLLKEALKNPTFKEIFTSERYTTGSTNLRSEGITFNSTMFQMMEGEPMMPNVNILGGKTGYTRQAGLCLASYAIVDGVEYILVTAGADGSSQTAPFHTIDALYIYKNVLATK